MGLEVAALVLGGLQVASGVMQYSEQRKADKAAKSAANAEAAIMEEDAKRASLQERIEADKVKRQQRVAFLNSGVDLEGSPLLVMNETYNKGEENAKNITDSTAARTKLIRQQGSVKRASLLGSVVSTASSVAGTYGNYKAATFNSSGSSGVKMNSKADSSLPWSTNYRG